MFSFSSEKTFYICDSFLKAIDERERKKLRRKNLQVLILMEQIWESRGNFSKYIVHDSFIAILVTTSPTIFDADISFDMISDNQTDAYR